MKIKGVISMGKYEENMEEEMKYLEETIKFLKFEIEKGNELISIRRENIIEARRDMRENADLFSSDFQKMAEVNQYLKDVNNQTGSYVNTSKIIEKYKRAIKNPYFGRFDFKEKGYDDIEKIYIGLCGISNSENYSVLVYDWRAPISGIYYQYEVGNAVYKSPVGDIEGEVFQKRQYKIENSELQYFIDSSVTITDEMLQEALSKNTSSKMKNIVETIQKEQNTIIRDTDNELLIIQGAAGSGKTSIALHRIAFLLYNRRDLGLKSNNIIIVSPNNIFSKYISNVLPELGEENVQEIIFDDIIGRVFRDRFKIETRGEQLESLILLGDKKEQYLKKQMIEFKGSKTFITILNRMLKYYERKVIPFDDVYYGGKIIESKQELKAVILNNKIGMPLVKRLNKLERILIEKVHPVRRERISIIEKIVSEEIEHQLEVKSFSRLLSIKEAKKFTEHIRKFTRVDYYDVYKRIFDNMEFFLKLSKGLKLPDNIEDIVTRTRENVEKNILNYEDFAALLYIKLNQEGNELFSDIKQVVIDEAQDYYPIHYEIFKVLFANSRYTVLGDVNQSIERNVGESIYDYVDDILDKRKSVKLFLNKSYRSSFEINEFNSRLQNKNQSIVSFERHEKEPQIFRKETVKDMNEAIAHNIKEFIDEGFESIAVICKSKAEAEKVHSSLSALMDIRLVNSADVEINKGIYVIPSYLAKGLEFDAVVVYEVSDNNYFNELDKKLLYIACTRALHRLVLYHTGEKSFLI